MRLLLMEIRKIFSWKILLMIGLANILLYLLLLDFHLKYFPNGRPTIDMFNVEQQLVQDYGAVLDESEREAVQTSYEMKKEEFDTYIQNDPAAQAAGIEGYEDIMSDNFEDEDYVNYETELYHFSGIDLPWEEQAWRWYANEIETRELSLQSYAEQYPGERRAYFENLLNQDEYGIYSQIVPENFINYKTNMAIIIFISIAILIAPVFLRDKRAGLLPLHYTSKTGRRVYRIKWFAGMISTAGLASALLVFYMMLYRTNDTSLFFDIPLLSFFNDFWYDMTFLEYILVSVAAIFLITLLLGIITMAISTVVPNSIVLIGVQIIVMFLMIAGGASVMVKQLNDLWQPKMLVPGLFAGLITISVIMLIVTWRREMRRDVV